MESIKKFFQNLFDWYTLHAETPLIFHTSVIWWIFIFSIVVGTTPILINGEPLVFILVEIIYMFLMYLSTHVVLNTSHRFYSKKEKEREYEPQIVSTTIDVGDI